MLLKKGIKKIETTWAAKIRQRTEKFGYAFIEQLQPGLTGIVAAQIIGELEPLKSHRNLSHLIPKSIDASTPNTYSGIYGLRSFPFHTDLAHWRMPPRYLVLRCILGFEKVPTLLADGHCLMHEVGRETLIRALVRPRRPMNGKFPLLKLFQPNNNGGVLRWDEKFLCPASSVGKNGMTVFANAIEKHVPIHVSLLKPGDTLVIDNWRMLHARADIPNDCNTRHIERTYLEALH